MSRAQEKRAWPGLGLAILDLFGIGITRRGLTITHLQLYFHLFSIPLGLDYILMTPYAWLKLLGTQVSYDFTFSSGTGHVVEQEIAEWRGKKSLHASISPVGTRKKGKPPE